MAFAKGPAIEDGSIRARHAEQPHEKAPHILTANGSVRRRTLLIAGKS
jgi:hypothetical protein